MHKSEIVAVGVVACCAVAWASLSIDEHLALEQAFSPTNTPRQVENAVYPILTNCWFVLSGMDSDHARELQYHVLTNACRFRSSDVEYWNRYSMSYRYDIFKMQCSFRCGTNDLAYLEQCADFIGRELSVVTNRVGVPPRVVSNFNGEVREARAMMLQDYRVLVERFERNLGEDVIASQFRSNIIQRARLSESETADLFRR